MPPPPLLRRKTTTTRDVLLLLLRNHCHYHQHRNHHYYRFSSSLPPLLSFSRRPRAIIVTRAYGGGNRNGTLVQLRRAADAESFGFAVELAPRMRHYAIRYVTTRPDETGRDETRHDTQRAVGGYTRLSVGPAPARLARACASVFRTPQMNSRRECARKGKLFCCRLPRCDCISLSIANSAVCPHNRRRRHGDSRRGASLAASQPQRQRAGRDGC